MRYFSSFDTKQFLIYVEIQIVNFRVTEFRELAVSVDDGTNVLAL